MGNYLSQPHPENIQAPKSHNNHAYQQVNAGSPVSNYIFQPGVQVSSQPNRNYGLIPDLNNYPSSALTSKGINDVLFKDYENPNNTEVTANYEIMEPFESVEGLPQEEFSTDGHVYNNKLGTYESVSDLTGFLPNSDFVDFNIRKFEAYENFAPYE